jgi:hypothetical protein
MYDDGWATSPAQPKFDGGSRYFVEPPLTPAATGMMMNGCLAEVTVPRGQRWRWA